MENCIICGEPADGPEIIKVGKSQIRDWGLTPAINLDIVVSQPMHPKHIPLDQLDHTHHAPYALEKALKNEQRLHQIEQRLGRIEAALLSHPDESFGELRDQIQHNTETYGGGEP